MTKDRNEHVEECPVCSSNRALQRMKADLDIVNSAIDTFIESGTNMEGNLYYLLDELQDTLDSWPEEQRDELWRRLDAAQNSVRKSMGQEYDRG